MLFFRALLSDIPLQCTRLVRVFSPVSVFGQVKNRIDAANSRHCPSGGYKLPLGSPGLRLLQAERPFFTQKDKKKKNAPKACPCTANEYFRVFLSVANKWNWYFFILLIGVGLIEKLVGHTHTKDTAATTKLQCTNCRRKVGIEMAGDATLEHAARTS